MLFALVAVFGRSVAPHDPLALSVGPPNLPPFTRASEILGTDNFGRDLWSRVLSGARLSFIIAVVPVAAGGLIGTSLGIVAGFGPRLLSTLIMRFVDVLLAFPSIMLALAIVAMRGPDFTNVIIALTVVFIGPMTRVSRGVALEVASRPYIEAARLSGASLGRIAWEFALPNMLPALMITLASSCGTLLLTGAGLSFLGVGAQPPDVEWGLMVAQGRDTFLITPWTSLLPGVFIFIVSVGFNRLADRLRDQLDPRWIGAR